MEEQPDRRPNLKKKNNKINTKYIFYRFDKMKLLTSYERTRKIIVDYETIVLLILYNGW